MWGFEEYRTSANKPMMSCLVRVLLEVAPKVIHLSGVQGWFFEPLRWEEPLTGALAKPPVVHWEKREESEAGPDYLARLMKDVGALGVARGDRQLGIRAPRTEGGPKVTSWKATKVPQEWDANAVAETMSEAGFEQVEVTAKLPRRQKQVDWIFRAMLPAGGSFMEINVDSTVLHVIAVPPGRG